MLQFDLAKIWNLLRRTTGGRQAPPPIDPVRRPQPRTLAELELMADPLPYAVSVEVTGSCNLKCTMCPLTEGTTSSGAAGRSMTPERWNRLLAELSPSVSSIAFTGFGEPMLNQDFGTMLLQADQLGIVTSFNTNGATLAPGFIDLASRLKHLAQINVSIDTVDDIAYRKLRGGKVSKALASLEMLNAAFGERHLVSASAVVMKSTIGGLPELARRVGELKVRNLVLQNLHDQSPLGLSEDISGVPDGRALVDEAMAVAADRRTSVHFEDRALMDATLYGESMLPARADGPDESRRCNIAWDMPHIDSLGGVYPCCRASAVDSEKLGDLNEASFEDIWNGPRFQDFRSRMLNRQGGCPSICAGCDTVPVGRPTIGEYAALLLLDESDLRGPLVRLKVRNVGSEPWTEDRMPVVGTSRRRDRTSTAWTPSWRNPQRPARPEESYVAPGETANYVFELAYRGRDAAPEWFQLVIDRLMWMTATSFAAGVDQPPSPWPKGGVSTATAKHGLVTVAE